MAARRPKLSDQVVTDIEIRILSGQLQAGERLPSEGELCEIFRVSRTVIRDALRTLAARGLLEVRQGLGTIVALPSSSVVGEALVLAFSRLRLTVGDVHSARAAFELTVAPIAARNATSTDVDYLTQRLEAFAAALSLSDWENVRDEHLKFHLGLLSATHMLAMELVLRPMQEVILLSSLFPNPEDSSAWDFDLHPPILDAIKDGNEDQAARAMRQHYTYTKRESFKAIEDMPFAETPDVRTFLESSRQRYESDPEPARAWPASSRSSQP